MFSFIFNGVYEFYTITEKVLEERRRQFDLNGEVVDDIDQIF